MKTKLFLIVLALAGAGCSSKTDGIDPKEFQPRTVFPAGAASELFQQLAPPTQKFTVSVKKDTTISCENGTVISIPKECFIDAEGNVVTENVTIEIAEAHNYSDMLRYNLQTVSDGKILQTGGMLYIDAKAGGKSLALQKDAALYVELPTAMRQAGMKLFTGDYDSTGAVNWTEESAIEEGLTPMPLEEFQYTYGVRYNHLGVADGRSYEMLDSVELQKNKKYENTYVATTDFEQRFYFILIATWLPHSLLNYENYKEKDGTYRMDETLMNFYLNNTAKPLWYADSLAYEYLTKRRKLDSIELAKKSEDYYPWWNYEKSFKAFYDQRIGNVKKFDAKGVDLSKPNAKEALIGKGYSAEQAADQLRMHAERQRFVAQHREQIRRRLEERKVEKQIAAEKEEYHKKIDKAFTTAFKVTKLGWVNVDRFLDDPKAKEVELFVQIEGDSIPEACSLSLLMPGKSIAMNGIGMGNNKYRFTKEEKIYSKLPVGEHAVIVAMASKGKQAYFALQPLTIAEKQTIKLPIKKSSWKEIEEKLAKMDKSK